MKFNPKAIKAIGAKTRGGASSGGSFKGYLFTSLICILILPLIILLSSLICLSTKDPVSHVGTMSLISFCFFGIACGIITLIRHKGSSLIGKLIPIFISSLAVMIFALIYSGKVGASVLMDLLCFILIALFILIAEKLFKRKNTMHYYGR
jgi:hypothetical protein